MTVALKNVDFQFFEVLKSLVKMRSDIEILQTDENSKTKNADDFFSNIDLLKYEYSDIFTNKEESKALEEEIEKINDIRKEPVKMRSIEMESYDD